MFQRNLAQELGLKNITCTLYEKDAPPPEGFIEVLKAVDKAIELDEFSKLWAFDHEFDGAYEWGLGTNYEDGFASTIFYNDAWWYRTSYGEDRPVPGGADEVIDNWGCYANEIG